MEIDFENFPIFHNLEMQMNEAYIPFCKSFEMLFGYNIEKTWKGKFIIY